MTESRRRSLAAMLAVVGLLASVDVTAPVYAASATFSQPEAITIVEHYPIFEENHTEIALGDPTGPGSADPTSIDVATPPGATISDIAVSVDIQHERSDDLDLMLVSPQGIGVILLSDAGGDNAVNHTLVFYREAPDWAPDDSALPNINLPTNWDTTPGDSDTYPAPAPTSAEPSFDGLVGLSPSGTWRLLAVDDTDGGTGVITTWRIVVYYDVQASPSPSTLTASGLPSGVTDVNLSLNALTLSSLGDIEVVLESPTGRRAHVLSDAGGFAPVSDLTLVLDDEADAPIPRDSLPGGGPYRPHDYDDYDRVEAVGGFNTANLSAALSTFDGTDPNGTWKLYVFQEDNASAGAISGGWSLQIATADLPAAPVITSPASGSRDADGTVTLTGRAASGSVIRVSDGPVALLPTLAEGGVWVVVTAGLAEGAHTFAATATDGFGNVSPASSITVVVDTIAPKVTKVSPKNKAKDVKRTVSPRLTFSEPMLASSLTKLTVILAPVSDGKVGKPVRTKLTYLGATKSLVVDPRHQLAGATTYRLTVKPAVRDRTGNSPAAQRTWRFTTA